MAGTLVGAARRAAALAPRRRAAAGRGARVPPGALVRMCGAHEAPAACTCCRPAARRGGACSTSTSAGAGAHRPRAVAVSAAGNAASSPPPEAAAGGAQSSPRDASRLRAVAGFDDFGGDEADAVAIDEGEEDALGADDAGCIGAPPPVRPSSR